MPDIHTTVIEVSAAAIDELGHVNNAAYVRWMQDAAVEHSTAQGWSIDRYLRAGSTWVVRSHFIEYLRPAFQGDTLRLATWVVDMERRGSKRRYLFWRDGDRGPVARAETLWIYVDLGTGRPRAIPDELRAAFPLLPDGDRVLERLGVRSGAHRPGPAEGAGGPR